MRNPLRRRWAVIRVDRQYGGRRVMSRHWSLRRASRQALRRLDRWQLGAPLAGLNALRYTFVVTAAPPLIQAAVADALAAPGGC